MSYGDSQGSGRALAILGDHWNLRILMAAFLGTTRFNDWQRELAISASVLTQRLQALVSDGLMESAPRADGRPGHEYRLTQAGKAIWTTMVCLWSWDERWAREAPSDYHLKHDLCGSRCHPVTSCTSCEAINLTAHDTRAEVRSPTFHEPELPGEGPPRYRRPAKSIASAAGENGVMRSADVLGDRWSAMVLSAAFLGSHRFSEFQARLDPIPPPTLSSRLSSFVDQGVLERAEVDGAAGYRLTVKGHDFFAVMVSIINWGAAWAPAGSATTVHHRHCGEVLELGLICNVCRVRLERHEVRFEPREAPDERP